MIKTKKIAPKGMVKRNKNEEISTGECLSLLNVRECDDSLEVVGDWEGIADVARNEKLMLVDHRCGVDYYLSSKDDTVYLHGEKRDGVYARIDCALCCANSKIKWIQSVGDFVVVGTEKRNLYLYYNGEDYKELRRDDLEPLILFRAVNETLVTQKVAGRDFNKSYSRWSALEERDRLELEETVTDAYSSLLAMAKGNGAYLQPVVVRYAVRLWDDSYAWVSAPVIVGSGVQVQSMISSQVNSSLTGYEDSAIVAKMYNIGAEVIKTPSKEWASLIKSIDILVSDELQPFIKGQIMSRCELSANNYYVTYGLKQRELTVALAEVINPKEWRVIERFYEIESLPRNATIMRSDLYGDDVERDMIKQIVNNIAVDVNVNTGVSLNGQLYMGGFRKMLRNAWKSAQYWGGEIVGQACEVIVTAKLRAKNGDVLKVNTEKYNYTPTKLNALVAFPDSRATELNVKILSGESIKEWNGHLIGVDNQGFSYFVNGSAEENEFEIGYSFYEETERNTEIDALNELVISCVGNPFVVAQNRSVGQTELLKVLPATKSIFSGVFGRYPLYAFSVDGIYAVPYKNTGDYKGAQKISHRVLGNNDAVALSGENVYFVSSSNKLCLLLGKDVKELDEIWNIAQLVWLECYKELLLMKSDNSVLVYTPAGRYFRRSEKLQHVYGGVNIALGQSESGKLVDLNSEQSCVKNIELETYPIALKKGEMTVPLELTINHVGRFAEDSTLNLCGSNGTECDWRILLPVSPANDCCHRIVKRVYARPCRLLKFQLIGNAQSGTIISDYTLKYL